MRLARPGVRPGLTGIGLGLVQISARALVSASVCASVLAIVGCGNSTRGGHKTDATTASMTTTSAPSPSRHAARAKLVVIYWPHGQGGPEMHTWSLRCDPPGGDHPRPAAACAEIERSPSALGRATKACLTRALPGSAEALVTGTFGSLSVDRFYRPGCQDWSTLPVLLTGR
jgi:hypothetical protein